MTPNPDPNHEIDVVVDRAVKQTLEALGFDVKNPIEIQKDIAFLRGMRNTSNKIGGHITLVAIGSFVLAVMGAIWLGVVQRITGHGPS